MPASCHLLTPPQQDEGENRKGKSEKEIVDQDKDSLTFEDKLQANQN